ncbi:hypothetical protein GGH92_006040, partial [Coemansia sp. RSA 2673]
MAVSQKSHQNSTLSEPLSAATAALCADRYCYMHLCADRFCSTHLCDTEPLGVKQKMVSMCKLSSKTTSPLQGSPELTPCKTQSTRSMSSSSASLPTVEATASPTVAVAPSIPVAPSTPALSYYRR